MTTIAYVSIGGSGLSGRETVVTLVACALLGFEAGHSFFLGLAVLLGIGALPSPLYSVLSLIGGCVLGAVLLRQGGISIPSRGERGASRGALVVLVVGGAAVYLLGEPIVGLPGICALVGLAVGRTFDRSSIRRSA